MKLRETLYKNWLSILGVLGGLVTILTLIVRTETVWHWIFPSADTDLQGSVYYTHENSSFFFPQSYTDDEQKKQFINAAQSFIKIDVQNVSNVEAAEMQLSLPSDAVLEVLHKNDVKHTYLIADSFRLDNLAANDRYSLLIWMKRPFSGNDQISLSNQLGLITFIPVYRTTLTELRFYYWGFYVLLSFSAALLIAVIVLSFTLYNDSKTIAQATSPAQLVEEAHPEGATS